MPKKYFGLALLCILAVILVINLVKDAQEKKSEAQLLKSYNEETYDLYNEGLAEGEIPPDFELETISGEKIRLSDLHGKKVILNFWATWCPPCKAEMPHMQNFFEQKAEEYNTEVIAVNLTAGERASNKKEKVAEFLEEYGITFPIPLDEKGKVGDQFGVISLPTTYVINTNGIISKKIIGPMDEELMEKLVKDSELSVQ